MVLDHAGVSPSPARDKTPLPLGGLLFRSVGSVVSDATEKVPTGRRADSL